MGPDVYVYEAIDVEPPISEAELEAKLTSAEYRKITWDDPRLGEGYFVQVGSSGMLGIAVVPTPTDDGQVIAQGVAIQVNPLLEHHLDEALEGELRKILADFGVSPGGIKRLFGRSLHIEKPDGEDRIVVRDGDVVRMKVG